MTFALQMLSSLYYGLFLALFLIPVGGSLWLARGRPGRPLRALAAGSESAARSHELETKRRFSPDGTEMEEEWGPLHQVRLETGAIVQACLHTTVKYDEG